MKKVLSLFLVVVVTLLVNVQAFAMTSVGYSAQTEKNMLNTVNKNKAEIVDVAKQIWGFKEQGLQEVKSSALIEKSLKAHGFTVQVGVTGTDPTTGKDVNFPTAFIATYEKIKGGPTVGVLVEYDALPNGHADGHNLMASCGLTAALAIQEALKTTPGKVIVYGTPAEETSGSKVQMLAKGLFKGVDVVFADHPMGNFWSAELNAKAMVWPKYEKGGLQFYGKASHASAAPEQGRSALDAAMLMGTGIEFLREHMAETDRVHYAILNGGKAANVVPDYTQVDLMVRANTTSELKSLTKRVENIIAGAALMTDTKATYEWDAPLLNAVPVPELWSFVAKTAPAAGISTDLFKTNLPAGGSTDAGNVGYEVPTAQVLFPVSATGNPANHSDEFREASITDYAINNSITAGNIMALSAYRLLTDPTELQKVKAEFAKNKQ